MFFNQVEFGQRVKALRKENGYTLQQMADELNVSYEHYKKILFCWISALSLMSAPITF